MDLERSRKEPGKMTVEEQLEKLTGIVDSLAGTVVAHDNQIEALIQIVEKHHAQIASDRERTAALERQWQAYINTLPRH
jgi:predicted  nucleic acid-binding Zn-ribbon protein